MREIRVALLSPVFWPEVRRGGERFVHELATGLVERGHRPTLITSHRGPTTRTREDGFDIVRRRRRFDQWVPRRWEEHLTHLAGSWLALRRGDFDLAHAVFPTDGLVAARWSESRGRPALLSYLGTPHGHWLDGARFRRRILQRALRSCTPVALSRVAAEQFREELGVEPPVIYPGVDLDAFAPDGERAPDPTVVCAAALEEPRKRVDLMIEAFALIRRQRPRARLVLDRPRDLGVAESLGASAPGIELRDLDDRVDLAAAYREAWVSVLPSVSEPLGLVLVEALACGTPVVGTSDLGIAEIIDREEVGRLFEAPPPTPEATGGKLYDAAAPGALARAVLDAFDLAQDPGTAEACRRRARKFSKHGMVESYERLYRSLLDHAPDSPG